MKKAIVFFFFLISGHRRKKPLSRFCFSHTFQIRSNNGSSSRFRFRVLIRLPGFDWIIRLSGSIFFFKSKRCHFSKKNKNQRVTTKFLTGSTGSSGQPGHTGFFIPLFFLQPSPVPVPDRPAGPGRVSKL